MEWVVFNFLIIGLILADLFFFHKKKRRMSLKEALWASLGSLLFALAFNVYIYFSHGLIAAEQFFTGYLIEKSLSIDNLFVISVIFTYFKVPEKYQHDVLFWGILGALVLRLLFILVGVALITKFHFVLYILGVLLLITGFKIIVQKASDLDVERNFFLRLAKRYLPITDRYHDGHFFTKIRGRWVATPLFLVVGVVEYTDVLFAIDSLPAIFAITTNTFIVYTSNVFAILGLRSLYFVLAAVKDRFSMLKYGLGAILLFTGFKMLLSPLYEIPLLASLAIVLLILGISIALSLHKRQP